MVLIVLEHCGIKFISPKIWEKIILNFFSLPLYFSQGQAGTLNTKPVLSRVAKILNNNNLFKYYVVVFYTILLVLSILKFLKLVFANNNNKISSFRPFLLYFRTFYRKILQVKHK